MTPSPRFNGLLLDYGHGGEIGGEYQTAGKQYHHTDTTPVTSIFEGIVQRQIAARLIPILLDEGVLVRDCVARQEWRSPPASWRDLEQRDVRLSQRVAYANQFRSWLFLSLHSNAVGNAIRGPSQRARGVEVYTSRGQTAADPVADTLLEGFRTHLAGTGLRIRRGDWSDGDQDMESGFYVLRKTFMPAVLGEVGFFTSLTDAAILLSDEGQQAIAEGYAAGVLPWLRRGCS